MELSTVQETVTVTGASPLVDTRETGTKATFDLETMQNIPSARDPWVMLERTPGIIMDRANVGGNQSGQQSGYISRGSSTGNNKWSIDGVDITDMAATGASPIYYDFDMLEEMQVTTGGADVTQQTGGVGINLVTKSGTDRFKGNGRALVTDEKFEDDNITPELKAQGAGSGAPIQNIKDYGFDVGGPIVKGKLWYWGSYGAQDIKVGVVGFYENTPECRPGGGRSTRARPTRTLLRSCLSTDLTQLHNYNVKLTYVPFTNNRLNFQNTWAEKVRNARDARRPASDRDHRPPEGRVERLRHLRLADRALAVLEGRRPARHQRQVARRRDVGAPRQQLRARLPRRRAARRAAELRDHDRPVGPLVQGVDVPPPDQQPRRRQQLLHAGEARRRSLAQVRLSLAQRALDEPEPSRRLHRRALHATASRPRPTSSATELRVAPQHQRVLRPGHVHQEPPDAEPRLPLRHAGRFGAGGATCPATRSSRR